MANTDDRALKMMKSEQRVALVIGNNEYEHKRLSNLQNPVNDARSMKSKLQELGFKVIYGENLRVRDMDRKLDAFTGDLKHGGVGLFFFAGHGVEHNGINYLMGKDSIVDDKNDVKYESLPLNKALDAMQDAGNRFNIVLLDACRNDPFSRSSGGGLAKSTAKGTFIAYATSPGDVASDGKGANGIFTEEILKNIDAPGIPIEQVFKNIKRGVIAKTSDQQRPWVYNDFVGDFFFVLPTQSAGKAPVDESNYDFVTVKPTEFSLTVNTTPSSAKVSITNIKTVYHDGIRLKPGNYNIAVSKEGYYPKAGTVDLKSDLSIEVTLEKMPSTQTTTTKKTLISKYVIVVTTTRTMSEAKGELMRLKQLLSNNHTFKRLQDEQEFSLVARKSGKFYMVVAEPINDPQVSHSVLAIIRQVMPGAYEFVRNTSSDNSGKSTGENITHNGITYGTVKSPYTGKVWLDRNLGAERVCQSFDDELCYGDYFQWGRAADGHEKVGSSSFKTDSRDWSSQSASSRQAFWMKTDGSGICPRGFRVPTIDELMAETVSQSFSNRNDAFNNFLKLPSAGRRNDYDGSMRRQGNDGRVWSSSRGGLYAKGLSFSSGNAYAGNSYRDYGFSVRCLKE
jgi:uncharacterized protein (TIGR02145 family)